MESLLETSVEVEQLESMLAKYSRVLQPGNAMLVRLKYSLAGLYGRAPGHQLFSLDREQIERKRKLCEDSLVHVEGKLCEDTPGQIEAAAL